MRAISRPAKTFPTLVVSGLAEYGSIAPEARRPGRVVVRRVEKRYPIVVDGQITAKQRLQSAILSVVERIVLKRDAAWRTWWFLLGTVIGMSGCADQTIEPLRRGPPATLFTPAPASPSPVLPLPEVTPDLIDRPPQDTADASSADLDSGIPDEMLFDASTVDATAPLGLCAPCTSGSQCGGENDHCLFQPGGEQSFCSRDCAEQDCPQGFECLLLSGTGHDLYQCVPVSENCTQDAGLPPRSIAQIAFEAVSTGRQQLGYPAVELDDCLTELAAESLAEFRQTGERHTKFRRECKFLGAECECNWTGQFQTYLSRDDRDPGTLVNDIFFDSDGPEHVGLGEHRRIGIVVAVTEHYVWITNAYGP